MNDLRFHAARACFIPLFVAFALLASMEKLAHGAQNHAAPTVVVRWNQATLQGIRDSTLGPPMISRALAIVHTCIYDAWAAYDGQAHPLYAGDDLGRLLNHHDGESMEKAISYAAYRCASDVLPGDRETVYKPLMQQLGYSPEDASLDGKVPQGIGNLVADAVLKIRHSDGSNQLGTLTPSGVPYADYSGYVSVNPPSTVPVIPALVENVDRWQPLQYVDASGTFVTQRYLVPFWGSVVPFSLKSGDALRGLISLLGPARSTEPRFLRQAQELIDFSANLTDRRKMIAEYWADGPRSETPPGHWNLFAQYVSERDKHTMAEDVKMFFALTNAVMDAGIVVWDSKRAFDSVRPVTAMPYLFQGKTIRSWGGPGRGTVTMDGRSWIPYQASTFPTPPFPEFISGHSTFSAAAAEILRLFTRSDAFGAHVSFAPGSSRYEPAVTPREQVILYWPTFSEAADEAGISRRYGGIHFESGDVAGRVAGRLIAAAAWRKASGLWNDAVVHSAERK